MTQSSIQGKVAAIVSEREVALNIGKKQGVKRGMRFAILAKTPLQIVDPDTKGKLGEVDREKVRVRTTDVKEDFSIAETFETYEVTTGGLAFIDPQLFMPKRTVRKTQTLRIDDASVPTPLPPEESFVQIGDRVVQLFDDIASEGKQG